MNQLGVVQTALVPAQVVVQKRLVKVRVGDDGRLSPVKPLVSRLESEPAGIAGRVIKRIHVDQVARERGNRIEQASVAGGQIPGPLVVRDRVILVVEPPPSAHAVHAVAEVEHAVQRQTVHHFGPLRLARHVHAHMVRVRPLERIVRIGRASGHRRPKRIGSLHPFGIDPHREIGQGRGRPLRSGRAFVVRPAEVEHEPRRLRHALRAARRLLFLTEGRTPQVQVAGAPHAHEPHV